MAKFITRTEEFTRDEEGMTSTLVVDIWKSEFSGEYAHVSTHVLDEVLGYGGWVKKQTDADPE